MKIIMHLQAQAGYQDKRSCDYLGMGGYGLDMYSILI